MTNKGQRAMGKREVIGVRVRRGEVKGAGLYARNEGCMCDACLAWVEDRGDSTMFPVVGRWPRIIARRDGGRVVRVTRAVPSSSKGDSK